MCKVLLLSGALRISREIPRKFQRQSCPQNQKVLYECGKFRCDPRECTNGIRIFAARGVLGFSPRLLSGDTSNARSAYKNFLALWKDADQDISILKQAKAECGKLQ